MRVCPKCGHRDGIYWRPRHYDTTIDIAQLEDIPTMEKEGKDSLLYMRLRGLPPGHTLTEGFYSYRVTRSGMVWRKETEFLDSEGWSVPSDGAGSPKSAKYKRDSTERGKDIKNRHAGPGRGHTNSLKSEPGE